MSTAETVLDRRRSAHDAQRYKGLPVRVALRIVGTLRPRFQQVDLAGGPRSLFFELHEVAPVPVAAMADPADGQSGYADRELARLVAPEPGYGLTIAVIDAPLREGYYLRRLSGNRVVVSTHEVAPLLIEKGYSLRSFVRRNVYQAVVGYIRHDGRLPSTRKVRLAHVPTRGCLYDWNDTREDILHSLDQPQLCSACIERTRLSAVHHLLPQLSSELRQIRKPILMRFGERFKEAVDRRPWLAIVAPLTVGIALNMLASWLYDGLKH